MAATFVTDFGTAVALSALFIQPSAYFLVFVVASILSVVGMLLLQPWFFARYGQRVIEPEIKGAFAVLFLLMWMADLAKSHAVLPAFLLGLAVARIFKEHPEEQRRFRVGPPLRPALRAVHNVAHETGLTFGTISSVYGLTAGIIDRPQFSVLVMTVILSAVVPTYIAQRFFSPAIHPLTLEEIVSVEDEEFEPPVGSRPRRE